MERQRSRTSALVILGVYVGVIAGFTVFPISIPLLYRLVLAESRATMAELYTETARLGIALDRETEPLLLPDLPLLRAVRMDGTLLAERGTLEPPPALEDEVCRHPAGVRPVQVDGHSWIATCYENPRLRVFALYPPAPRSYVGAGLLVVALAAIAGLTSAIGVLRILRPLSQIEKMLDRVGSGERGLRMRTTKIKEIDDLIERLNSAASAVEEREQRILAQVQVAQEIARLVAHEVRNPLQSIELLTSLLRDEADPAERAVLAESIRTEIRTLDDVVTRLLREGVSRGSLRLHLHPHDVDELLAHVVRLKRSDAEKRGIKLLFEPGCVGAIPIDRPLLSRSIENLVNNALRATPAGGTIRLDTELHDDQVLILVEDSGPGIDPSLGEAVFDVNVSGEGGSGLGLSLTKGVVEGHGGQVGFEQSPLGGARFVLRLPRNEAENRSAVT